MAWRVVEQEHFVVAGQEFADETLKFYRTVAHADRDGTDVVLFSSSLCYLPAPAEFLDQVATSSAQYLLIDRLPVVEAPRDRIALQRVGEPILHGQLSGAAVLAAEAARRSVGALASRRDLAQRAAARFEFRVPRLFPGTTMNILFEQRKVLISGGCGFIGPALARRLVELGRR